MLIAVNYHYIRPSFDQPYPGIHGITPDHFERQLNILGGVGKFVSANDLRSAIYGTKVLPPRSLMVTFDDGLREQYDFAWPVLKRLGIPALFFINTAPIQKSTVSVVHKIHLLRANMAPKDFLISLRQQSQNHGVELSLDVDAGIAMSHYKYDTPEIAQLKFLLNLVINGDDRDRIIDACFQSFFFGQESVISKDLYMQPRDVSDLAHYGCVGTHAHEHLPLGLLPSDKIATHINLSVECLEKWTGKKPFSLSYPYGSKESCSGGAPEIATHFGIEFAFTMERAGNYDLDRPLSLARFDNNDLPGGKASKWGAEELFDAVPEAAWHLG